MEVAGGDRGQAISPSPELTGLIGVGQTLCIALRITDGPANPCFVVRDEVFRILVWVRGGRRVLGPSHSASWWGGGGRWGLGLRCGGGRLGKGGCRGSHTV